MIASKGFSRRWPRHLKVKTALGQKLASRNERSMSVSPLTADINQDEGFVSFLLQPDSALQQPASPFDHLVGAREHCRLYGQAERFVDRSLGRRLAHTWLVLLLPYNNGATGSLLRHEGTSATGPLTYQ